jgi:hypothetical protein
VIVIKNIGHGVASDVVFRLSRPIPEHAWGLVGPEEQPTIEMKSGPLVSGIPLLAPGESREIPWGQFGGLQAVIGDGYITVTCNYSHGSRPMQSVSRLEVASFRATNANSSDAARIAEELKRIADASVNLSRTLDEVHRDLDRDKSPPRNQTS